MGKPQLNPGTIKDGTQINIVPNFCDLEVDRRIVFSEDRKKVGEEILRLAQKYDPDVEFKVFDKGNPYLFPSRLILKDQMEKWFPNLSKEQIKRNDGFLAALKRITGKSERYLPAYTEADHYFTAFGIPTIILGLGSIKAAHIDSEYVDINEIIECTHFYKIIIEQYIKETI